MRSVKHSYYTYTSFISVKEVMNFHIRERDDKDTVITK
jgi:hypothetical protein